MKKKATIMATIQSEIDRVKNGMFLLVKLLNKDELNVLLDDAGAIIDKFHMMVENACQKVSDCKIIKASEQTKIYIILPDDAKAAEKLAYSIYSQVQLYIDEKFPESYLRCVVGSIKFSDKHNIKVDKLLSLLIYGAISSGEVGYYYSYDDNPVEVESLRKRNVNLNLLRSALLQKKARFAYQPIVDRISGNIEYYECLLRVADEKNNFISVGPMIADAENKGLINIVDFTVIDMVINELIIDKKVKLSVNISNAGVLNRRLLKRIESLLKKHPVADRLIIEITETSINNDFETSKKFIDTLHTYGCRFALDDFGSGFTSFKQLFNLPVDIIKIDGSYIRDIQNNKHNRFFVEYLINLAADLGIKTIAEFVENGEIAKVLMDLKVDGMQGNFFLPASSSRI
jgi:EAL domain-containing protein (putative c-di-GMP-specific phosphodiesterase class I)